MPYSGLRVLEPELEAIFTDFYDNVLSDIHLAVFFRDQEQVRELIGKQSRFFIDSLGKETEELRRGYEEMGVFHQRMGIALFDVVAGLEYVRTRMVEVLAARGELNALSAPLEEFFLISRQCLSKGYLKLEAERLMAEYREEMGRSLHYRLLLKWAVDFIDFFRESQEGGRMPDMTYERSAFKAWLDLPQLDMVFAELADKEEIARLHKSLHLTSKSMIHHLNRHNYYETYALLEKFSGTAIQLMHLLDRNIVLSAKSQEESFFRSIRINGQAGTAGYVSAVNVRKLGLINKYRGVDIGDMVMAEAEAAVKAFIVGIGDDAFYVRSANGEFYLYFPEIERTNLVKVQDAMKQHLESIVLKVEENEFRMHVAVGTIRARWELPYRTHEKLLHYALSNAKYEHVETFYLEEEAEANALELIEKSEAHVQSVEEALAKRNLEIHLQPIMDVATGEIYDVEVLARIKKGETHIPAGVFIDLIHELEIVVDLDIRILEKVIEYAPRLKSVTSGLFINVSPASLRTYRYVSTLEKGLAKLWDAGIDPVFELTEQSFLDNLELIKQLHWKYGIKFAVDDFGTGYSSLRTVADLAEHKIIDFIKIDGSLIKTAPTSKETFQILDAASYMTKKLGLKNIAEFIEDEEMLGKVKELGIEYGQGYFFEKPLTVDALVEKYGK